MREAGRQATMPNLADGLPNRTTDRYGSPISTSLTPVIGCNLSPIRDLHMVPGRLPAEIGLTKCVSRIAATLQVQYL